MRDRGTDLSRRRRTSILSICSSARRIVTCSVFPYGSCTLAASRLCNGVGQIVNNKNLASLPVTAYEDALADIREDRSVREKLDVIHREVNAHYPFVDRIAVAIYESERDLLKTFVYSCGIPSPLQFYQTTLRSSDSLSEIAATGRARVVNDLSIFDNVRKLHSERIGKTGYGSSYTVPFYSDGTFAGLIFANSYQTNVFTDSVCHGLSPFAHLIGLLVLREMDLVRILYRSVSSALDISHHRDPETGAHLDRMSRYARIIANELAPRHDLDDEYVEFIYRFAPLHDVGKIAIPDRILLKPGRLDEEEYREMQTHARKGREIMDRMLANFRLEGLQHIGILRNIIEFHHEAIDGSGYPDGLSGDAVPLEARIITVADIFDALTSARPYKSAWSNDDAFAELKRISGSKVDPRCVDALMKHRPLIEEIQRTFQDAPVG